MDAIFHHTHQQSLDPRILGRVHRFIQPRIKLFDILLGMRQKIRKLIVVLRTRRNVLDGKLQLLIIKFRARTHFHHIVALEKRDHRLKSIPHFSGNCAGAIRQLKLQPGPAGPRRSANFLRAHQKCRRDRLSVAQIGNKERLHCAPAAFFAFFESFLSGASGVGVTSLMEVLLATAAVST